MGLQIWWLSNIRKSLFGAVMLVKNADIDKYKYSGYGIGFDRHGTFSLVNEFGKNVIFWSRYELFHACW